jgi:hypothetical protein
VLVDIQAFLNLALDENGQLNASAALLEGKNPQVYI